MNPEDPSRSPFFSDTAQQIAEQTNDPEPVYDRKPPIAPVLGEPVVYALSMEGRTAQRHSFPQ